MSFFLVDPKSESITEIQEPKLDEYANLIGCKIVAGIFPKVGKLHWTIYFDDEGMLDIDYNAKVSLITRIPPLAGKLIICQTDRSGKSVGLPIGHEELRRSIKFKAVASKVALEHAKTNGR